MFEPAFDVQAAAPTRDPIKESGVGRAFRKDHDIKTGSLAVTRVGRTVPPAWGRAHEVRRDLTRTGSLPVAVRASNQDDQAVGIGRRRSIWTRGDAPPAALHAAPVAGMGEWDTTKVVGLGVLGVGLAVLGFMIARRLRQ